MNESCMMRSVPGIHGVTFFLNPYYKPSYFRPLYSTNIEKKIPYQIPESFRFYILVGFGIFVSIIVILGFL